MITWQISHNVRIDFVDSIYVVNGDVDHPFYALGHALTKAVTLVTPPLFDETELGEIREGLCEYKNQLMFGLKFAIEEEEELGEIRRLIGKVNTIIQKVERELGS